MPLYKTLAAAIAAATSRSPALPGRAREEEVDDPTAIQVIKNGIYGKPVCPTTSLGLIDLVTHVNGPTTIYTRQCSLSLPSGLGILPHGSKTTADSSPPDDTESLIGQCMVEILEVSANFPFVGTIMVCDMHSTKTLYKNHDWDQPYYEFLDGRDKWMLSQKSAVGFKHKLELIGPHSATTADYGFDIIVCIPATRRKASQICKLSCSGDNIRLHNKIQTRTIVTNRGCLYVTCSVLPEALDGFARVLLQVPSHWRGVAGATVYGRITARFEKFDIGSTLFNKDLIKAVALEEACPDDVMCSEEGFSCMRVPLTRSNLAVPLGECLHVEGKLQVCGFDATPITIDHRIVIDRERMCTPWIKSGESSSAVRMWLGYIF